MSGEDRRKRPPVPGWLGALGEPVYRWAVSRRNTRFDRGEDVTRFPLPVISVGNLSVGGTGKTPMVALVVRRLVEMGRRPAVVMRGYKRRAGEMSDEQAEYAALFGDSVRIEADPDRCRAISRLIREDSCGCVVLDDGFQHRRVARDLDIVLIDAMRDVFEDRLLPRGWLREPVGSLARAGVVVMTHADAFDEADRERVWQRVRAVAGGAVRVEAEHAWAGLRVYSGGVEQAETVEWLLKRRVDVACGVGNPSAFAAQVRRAGGEITREMFMPDHHRWSAEDVSLVMRRDGCVVTTMKDWVKLREIPGSRDGTWVVPRLEMRIVSGADGLDAAVRRALGVGPSP